MIYSPMIPMLEKAFKAFFRWFFLTWLFTTREMQDEVRVFFETGKTSFRYFEWLNINKLKAAYPGRWKHVMFDYAGAYAKLMLLAAFVVVLGVRFAL